MNTCDRCSASVPESDGHYWCPNRERYETGGDRHGEIVPLRLLCDPCHGELCLTCERDFFAPSIEDVEIYRCPGCGETCAAAMVAFFKGEATITFVGCPESVS